MHSPTLRRAIGLLCAATFAAPALADSAASSPAELSRVTIVGSASAARDIGGSAHFVGPDELEKFEYADVLRILRSVPGVYIQEEEGFGQRPNIGIRGSGQDRSSRIAVLEDGVLIAPAPYSAPAAYHFPLARRIYAVEVLKGPAAILVGPRTIGGAINMISTPIPTDWSVYGDLFYGENSTTDARAVVGGSGEHYGLMLETVQQESDGFKKIDDNDLNTKAGYDISDWLLKARVNTSANAALYQALEFKYGRLKQDAQQSYLGLTDEDFAVNPFRLYAATQVDQLDTDHMLRQLSWAIEPAAQPWKLSITAYNNAFDRSWYRVNNVQGTGLSAIVENPTQFAQELDWLKGGNSPDDALRARDNARSYISKGVQGRGEVEFDAGAAAVLLKAGVRYHEDYEDRLQREDRWRMEAGNMVLTTLGTPGSQDNRRGETDVRSGFVAADIDVGAWRISPGVRFERLDLKRTDFSRTDPTRAQGPTRVRESDLSEWITGIGVTYALNDRVKLIGGLHEGFNPPSPGSDADAETSTNWEFGVRYEGRRVVAEAIGFITDYDNLVGTVTESTGGGGEIGDQFDGGEAVVRGIELLADTVLWEFAGGWRIPARLTWTWTPDAKFQNSFQSNFAPWGNVSSGDRMPYVPENVGQLQLGLEQDRLEVVFNINYQSETRTVAGQGAVPRGQQTDSHVVVDLASTYRINRHFSVQARIQNLLDREFITSRSPNGARPGIDRWALIGVRANF